MTAECWVFHYKGIPLWDHKGYMKDANGKWGPNPAVKDVPYFGGWSKTYKKESYAKSALTNALDHFSKDKQEAIRKDMRIVRYLPEDFGGRI